METPQEADSAATSLFNRESVWNQDFFFILSDTRLHARSRLFVSVVSSPTRPPLRPAGCSFTSAEVSVKSWVFFHGWFCEFGRYMMPSLLFFSFDKMQQLIYHDK